MLNRIQKIFLPSMVMLLLLFSCSRNPVPPVVDECSNAENDLSNSMVGLWRSDALVVGIDTIHNSGMDVILSVTQDEWTEKLQLQPIQTIFNQNKTYISAYTTTDGKLIRVTAGKWDVGKNRLNIHQLYPNDMRMNYRLDVNDGFAEIRSRLDFDGDGKNDDMFYCQMKKVS